MKNTQMKKRQFSIESSFLQKIMLLICKNLREIFVHFSFNFKKCNTFKKTLKRTSIGSIPTIVIAIIIIFTANTFPNFQNLNIDNQTNLLFVSLFPIWMIWTSFLFITFIFIGEINSIIQRDIEDKSYTFLFTFPINRNNLYVGRILSIITSFSITIFLNLFISGFVTSLIFSNPIYIILKFLPIQFMITIISTIFQIFIISIGFVFNSIFSSMKTQIILIITIFLILFIIPIILSNLVNLNDYTGTKWFDSYLYFIDFFNYYLMQTWYTLSSFALVSGDFNDMIIFDIFKVEEYDKYPTLPYRYYGKYIGYNPTFGILSYGLIIPLTLFIIGFIITNNRKKITE